jgi:hypothetical protein
LDLVGLVSSIADAAAFIDVGRKGFATKGKAEEGRISYEDGIAKALSSFQEAQATANPQIMILAEYTFITQELQFCEKSDKDSLSSLTKAIQSFNDAFLALQAVEEDGYKTAEKTYPHNGKYRVKGFPIDSFHIACIGHRTRIRNMLKTPGIDRIEKTLLKQRFVNLSAAQNGYIEKQKLVVSISTNY